VKINEELRINIDKKIRDSIHDIIISIENNEYYNLGDLSNILRHKYNIFITPDLLERLFILWEKNKKGGVFDIKDKVWLNWDSKNKFISNNLSNKKSPSLGKSRRKLRREEEELIYVNAKKDGWIKLRDGRFVYNGNIKIDIKDDEITPSIYEFEKYNYGDNPISVELIQNVYDINHNIVMKLYDYVYDAIEFGKIESNPENGRNYYYECFNYMRIKANKMDIPYKKGWIDFAPFRIKKFLLRKEKKKILEDEQEINFSKFQSNDKENMSIELSKLINLNKKYYILVTKHNTKKKKFIIKKIIFGYFVIDKLSNDKYYKIYIRKEKDGENIMHFNTVKHFEKCLTGGLKGDDEYIFNIIEDLDKIKFYYNELQRYKEWEEYLDIDLTNKIRNDF
jgi:hypothetical protein